MENENLINIREIITDILYIKYKNIDNLEQASKINEELLEIIAKLFKFERDKSGINKDKLVSEIFDIIQASFTMLFNIIEIDELEGYYQKHKKKIIEKYNEKISELESEGKYLHGIKKWGGIYDGH